jgi:hypothetical protein
MCLLAIRGDRTIVVAAAIIAGVRHVLPGMVRLAAIPVLSEGAAIVLLAPVS